MDRIKQKGDQIQRNLLSTKYWLYDVLWSISLGIQVSCQKVIGDDLCRLGGPKYLLRSYVDP